MDTYKFIHVTLLSLKNMVINSDGKLKVGNFKDFEKSLVIKSPYDNSFK